MQWIPFGVHLCLNFCENKNCKKVIQTVQKTHFINDIKLPRLNRVFIVEKRTTAWLLYNTRTFGNFCGVLNDSYFILRQRISRI